MSNFRNMPIRRKQTLIIMLISSVTLLLACAAFVAYDVSSFRRELTEKISSMAEVIGNNCTAALDFNDPKSAEQTLAALRAEPNIVIACVYNRHDEVFATYKRPDAGATVKILPVRSVDHEFSDGQLRLFRPITLQGETIGTIFLISSLDALKERVKRYAIIVAIVFAVSLLAAFALSMRLQRVVSDPILHLAQVARSVAVEKNYSVRATKRGGDELGQLVDGFNEMLTQIQERNTDLQAARDNLERRVEERTNELAYERDLLKTLMDHLPESIYFKDLKSRFVRMSKSKLERAFEFSLSCHYASQPADDPRGLPDYLQSMEAFAQYLTGKSDFDFFAEKDARLVYEEEQEVIRTGKPIISKLEQVIQRDGTKAWFLSTKMPWRDRDGNIIGTFGTSKDITSIKVIEEALRESQALYHSLVEQLPAGVFRKDAEGRYVFVNSWFCKLKGVTADQFLGKKPQEVAFDELKEPDANRSQIAKLVTQGTDHHEQIMQTGQQIELEEHYASTDGNGQYMHVVKSPILDLGGKVIGTQGILFDITERKRAEAELAYERHLLRSLLESVPDAIYFKDRESRFIRCSRSMAQLFKIGTDEEIAGKTDFDFFTEAHARQTFEDEQEIIRTGQPLIGKTEKETWPDGHVTWALTSKMPLRDVHGEIIGTYGISKDITPIKDAETKLEEIHRQLLDTSRQAGMAEVATSVLHNVGNVLNSVNTSAAVITDKLRGSKISGVSRLAELLEQNRNDLAGFLAREGIVEQVINYQKTLAQHLAAEQSAVLNELRDLTTNIEHIKEIVAMQQSYAKVSGLVEIQSVPSLVEDALRMHAGGLTRHGVKVVRQFEDVPDIPVDKHKVLQILVNLISNAKYALTSSGETERVLTLGVKLNGGSRLYVTIADNGIGIATENLTRIFAHGFTTKKNGHGFGLHSGALAAREMGGTLGAKSDGPGKGATFTLELPIQS